MSQLDHLDAEIEGLWQRVHNCEDQVDGGELTGFHSDLGKLWEDLELYLPS